MKITFTSLFFFFSICLHAQIVEWNFNATNATALEPTTVSANVTESNMSFGSGITSGNQVSGSGCGQAYTSSGYQATFSSADYWEFTLTPDATYTVDVTAIDFDVRVSNAALGNFEIRSSLDAYAAAIGSGSGFSTSCAAESATITMAPSTAAVTFRLYFWGASAATTTLRIDNLSVNGDVALPVTLISFEATTDQKTTQLHFTTATEQNNDRFEIEHSIDGSLFKKVGEVKGAGTTFATQHYTFTHDSPKQGTNYYRLRQVDFDGQYANSPVRSVTIGSTKAVKLFPTPVTESMNVQLEQPYADDAQWQVLDMTGRVVSEGVFAAEQVQFAIPVATLTEGAYVLRITAGNEVVAKQFRKQ